MDNLNDKLKEYDVKEGTINYGREYENKTTAFVALKAALYFENFDLGCNVRNVDPLDDIYLETIQNKEKRLYLFQIKNRDNGGPLGNKYCNRNYIETLNKKYIQIKECNKISPIFIFFTNASIESRLFLRCNEYHLCEMFSTTENGEIFKINGEKIKLELDQSFLDNCFYFSKQKDVTSITEEIFDLIKSIFNIKQDQGPELPFSELINDFLDYINNYTNIYERKQVLTKKVIHKLLFYTYLKKISTDLKTIDVGNIENCSYNFQKYPNEVWKLLKDNKVILKKHQLLYVKKMILNNLELFSAKDEYLNMFFKNELNLEEKYKKYNIGCLYGELPFIIKECHRMEIMERIENFDEFKIIYYSDISADDYKCINLNDDICNEILNMQLNHKNCTVYEMISKYETLRSIMQNVTPSDLLDTYIEEKTVCQQSAFNTRYVCKVSISKNFLINIDKKDSNLDLHIIYSRDMSKENFIKIFNLDENEVISDKDQGSYKNEIKYILTNNFDYEKLVPEKNIHYFELENNFSCDYYKTGNLLDLYFYWRGTYGSTENIYTFLKSSDQYFIKLDEMPNYFKSKLVIISGVPGIGKTVAMEQLTQALPTHKWVLFIKLRESISELETLKNYNNSTEILNLLNPEKNSFYRSIFSHKIETKEIALIFDGYDEVSPKYHEHISKIIKNIIKDGYPVYLTTRSVLQKLVEKTFTTFAVSLKPFDVDEQHEYLHCYFRTKSIEGFKIKKLCFNIMNDIKTKKVCDAAFTSNPLHIKLISEIISKQLLTNEYKIGGNKYFEKLELFKYYVREKLDIVLNTSISEYFKEEDILRYHKYFAVRKLFSNLEHYDKIDVDKEINIFSFMVQRGTERTGLLIDDFNEIFIHRSIAEYFGAYWLKDNLENFKESKLVLQIITNDIFNKEYELVRYFYDALIYNSNKVYSKIMLKEFDSINEEEVSCSYSLKRNILHLLVLWLDINEKQYGINPNFRKLFGYVSKHPRLFEEKDELNYTPLQYIPKRIEKSSLKIFINRNNNINIFYFNKPFSVLELINCKDIHKSNQNDFDSITTGLDIVFNNELELFNDGRENSFVKAIQNKDDCALEWLLTFKFRPSNLYHIVIKNNQYNFLEILLKNNIDINSIDENGYTPIMYATKKQDIKYAEFFINNQANITSKNFQGMTALHIAAINDNIELIKILVKNKAQLVEEANNGKNALEFAIENKSINAIRYFLKKEFINIASTYFERGLQLAAKYGDLEVFKAIFETELILHKIAILSACENGNLNIIKYLYDCKNNNIIEISDSGNTLLHIATKFNYVDIVDYLVDKLNNLDIKNERGETALHIASACRHIDVIKILIDKGVELACANSIGDTPLHKSAENGHLNIAQVLLDKDPHLINKLNFNNQTPLHYAAKTRRLNIVEFFIQKGANINIVDKDGNTPIHLSSSNGFLPITNFLIDNEAEIDILNDNGYNILHLAVDRNDFDMVDMLIRKTNLINSLTEFGENVLHIATKQGWLKIMEHIFNTDMINSKDKDGFTPLHYATKFGKLDIVQFLLSNNADFTIQDVLGWTPLDYAINKKHIAIIKIFFDNSFSTK